MDQDTPGTQETDAVRAAVEQALDELWPQNRWVRLAEVRERAMAILSADVEAEVERRLASDEDAAYERGREAAVA